MKLFYDPQSRFRFTSLLWIIYGITAILRYQSHQDEFLLWSGIIILVLHALLFIAFLFRKQKRENSTGAVK